VFYSIGSCKKKSPFKGVSFAGILLVGEFTDISYLLSEFNCKNSGRKRKAKGLNTPNKLHT